MASTEGPTAAITQAVNLSVGEGVNNIQNEPLPVPSNKSAAGLTADPPVTSENVSKPTTEATEDETSTAQTFSKPISNIPTPQNTIAIIEANPSNGNSNGPDAAPSTDGASSEAPKTSNSGDSAPATSVEVPAAVSQLKAQDTQNKDSHKESSDATTKANCENKLPSTTQEIKPISEDMEVDKVDKVPVDGTVNATPNGGSSAIDVPAKSTSVSKPIATIKPMVESNDTSGADEGKPTPLPVIKTNNKRPAEDTDEPDKRLKIASSSPAHPSSSSGCKSSGKNPEQILDYMEKSFEHRRKIITKQMPTIPELKELYPDLFRDKQLVVEFQRITKIDIDQKIQEFCVRNATAVIEMARSKTGAQPVLARWEQAKQENEALKQYWDMVTALCLLPLHFGENFVEMVLEIEEDEEVQAQGKIVPTLIARGNIFRTDEFFLIAENTIVQEFEEFTIAFASLYASYWVFNMVYPETIENTYNFIQRCIVKQKEPGAIPTVCKNFTKTLQKWNKSMKKT